MSGWFKQSEIWEDFYLACDFWSMFVMETLRPNFEIFAKGHLQSNTKQIWPVSFQNFN